MSIPIRLPIFSRCADYSQTSASLLPLPHSCCCKKPVSFRRLVIDYDRTPDIFCGYPAAYPPAAQDCGHKARCTCRRTSQTGQPSGHHSSRRTDHRPAHLPGPCKFCIASFFHSRKYIPQPLHLQTMRLFLSVLPQCASPPQTGQGKQASPFFSALAWAVSSRKRFLLMFRCVTAQMFIVAFPFRQPCIDVRPRSSAVPFLARSRSRGRCSGTKPHCHGGFCIHVPSSSIFLRFSGLPA